MAQKDIEKINALASKYISTKPQTVTQPAVLSSDDDKSRIDRMAEKYMAPSGNTNNKVMSQIMQLQGRNDQQLSSVNAQTDKNGMLKNANQISLKTDPVAAIRQKLFQPESAALKAPANDQLMESIQKKRNDLAMEQARVEAEESTLAGIVRNVYGGMVGSITTPLGTAADLLQGKKLNANASYNRLTQQANVAQQALQDKAAETIGAEDGTLKRKLSDLAVGSGLSVLQTAARLPLAMSGIDSGIGNANTFVGQAINAMTSPSLGSLQAGLSAGSNALIDAKNKGATDKQAVASGLAQGINEGLFESWSLGNLIQDKAASGIKEWVKFALQQMGAEGSEEMFTDWANDIADRIIMKDKSEFATLKKNYMENGASEKDATVQAQKDIVHQSLWSFAGGALAGAVLGGANSAIDTLGAKMDAHVIENAQAQQTEQNMQTEQNAQNTAQITTEAPQTTDSIPETVTPQETAQEDHRALVEEAIKDLQSGNEIDDSKYRGKLTDEDMDEILSRVENTESEQETAPAVTENAPAVTETTTEAAQETEQAAGPLETAVNEATKEAKTKGTVDTSKVDMKNLGRKKQVHVNVLSGYVSALGANVEWYTSKPDAQGKYHGENGSYDPATNTFRFDTNAGAMDVNDSEKMNTVVSHEVTHWMEQNSPEAYEEVKRIVFDALNTDGSLEARITEELQNMNEYYGDGHTREQAESEIIARACEDMLSESGKAKEMLSKMSKESRGTLIERVKDMFDRIRGYYKSVLQNLNADSEEAKRIRYNAETFEKLAKAWDKASEQVTEQTTEQKTERKLSDRDYTRRQQETENTKVTREELPLKAKVVVTKARNKLIREVGNIIGADTMDNIKGFRDLTNKMVDEYLETGKISKETVNAMFEDAYKYSDAESETKADESMKYYQLQEFQKAVDMLQNEIRNARRYAAAQVKKTETTVDEVQEVYRNYTKARRDAEKVKANTLLTPRDQSVLGMLLRGETTMEEVQKMKDLNHQGIKGVYEAQKPYEEKTRAIQKFNKERKAKLAETADSLLKGSENWKDKNAGIRYERETAERNVWDIAPKEEAEALIREYFAPVHSEEANSTRTKNEYRDRVKKMDLSRKVAEGNKVSESYAVQYIGEAQDNMRRASEKGKKYGKTADEWQADINNFWAENPNLDQTKIENAIKEFGQIYKELREKANEVLIRNGYEPIEYRAGYFPHFQEQETDGIVAQFKKVFGVEADVSPLPTTINGRTGTFKPGRTWFGNVFSRKGTETKVDAVQGFDKYIQGISDVIYQTDNIQKLRALAQQIRYNASDEGIQKQVDEIMANDELTWDEQRLAVNELFDSNKDYALSNFVVWLEEYTNLLANKKSKWDRAAETALGRDIYNVVKSVEGNIAGNMVALNPASWLTNLIPLTQAMTTTETKYLLKGMAQTLSNQTDSDGFVGRSDFLTNRFGSEELVKGFERDANPLGLAKTRQDYARLMDKLSVGMDIFDDFTAESIVRGRYLMDRAKGMSDEMAMDDANNYAASIMADRSKGSMPTLFGSRNPMVKAFTMFQLEVNNEFSWMLKDVPKELKDKTVAQIAASILKFLIGTYIFNDVYEFIVGRRPALDPLNILNDAQGDLTGYKLPNMIDLALGKDGFKTEKTTLNKAGKNLASNLAEELPFAALITGGGRIPISSALPDAGKLYDVATDNEMSGKKKAETLARELGGSALYLALPAGGGQIKKVAEGAAAIAKGGSYTYNKQGELTMQYPVYKDTVGDVLQASVKAALFGKSSFETARRWVDSGFKSFSADQTKLYNDLREAGMTDRDSYKAVKEVTGIKKTEEASANELKREFIEESDMTAAQKELLYEDRLLNDDSREKKLFETLGAEDGALYEAMVEYHKAEGTSGEKTRQQIKAIRESKLTDEEKATVYYELQTKDGDKDRDLIDEIGLKAADLLMDMRGAGSKDDGSRTNAEKREDIKKSDLTEEEKKKVYLYKLIDTDSREKVGKQIETMKSQGVSFDDYLSYKTDLEKFSGEKKKENVIAYIKKQPEKCRKNLWVMAGYDESTYEKNFTETETKATGLKKPGLKSSKSLELAKP